MQLLSMELEIAADSPSGELVAEVNRVCDQLEDSGAPVLVLRIRGGSSPAHPLAEPDMHLFTQWERAVRRVERAQAVTVAAAEGLCGWLQTGILLATDYRIARIDLRVALHDGTGHVVPGMGLYRVATQIGVARSRRLALLGEIMSADEALALGLIDEIAEELDAPLAAIIRKVSHLNAGDLAVRRRLLLEAPNRSFEDALGTHLAARDRSMRLRETLVS